MRIVVFGAGAVGSVIGGRLHQHRELHGNDVTLVARRSHCDAIRDHGLIIHDPAGTTRIDVPAVDRIDEVALVDGDVVILTMKTQDTPAALESLVQHAPPRIAVVCAQNGVENERLALRRFANVHGICVVLPAAFMEPGVIDASGAPHNAILDIGRYPGGVDETTESIAAALRASDIASEARPDIMAWKYCKLMMNLTNALDALVSDTENISRLLQPARAEADACMAAAGIVRISSEVDRARRAGTMEVQPLLDPTRTRGGGSTWQSLARGATSTEIDWLNGEIAMLGRIHGVATPVNTMLCDVARWAAATGVQPRSMTTDQLLARLLRDAGR